MKTALLTTAIGVCSLILGENARATDAVTVSTSTTEKKVRVQVAEPRLQDISVYVTNEDGNIIYQEDIRASTTYAKVYDLSKLDDGIYTFTSSGELITTTKEIKVEGSSTTELSREAEYQPYIYVKDNHLRVNYFNKNQEDIEFSIVSSKAIFHESKEGNDIAYGKLLDISNMPSGEYFARLKVGNKQYYHAFKKP
jgi:hypothetical protein